MAGPGVDYSGVLALACAATTVIVTEPGHFDPKRRHAARPMSTCRDPARIAALLAALDATPESLAAPFDVMMWGTLDLNFLRGHELLTTVTWLAPDMLRHPAIEGAVCLADPDGLRSALNQLQWEAPRNVMMAIAGESA